MTSRREFLKVAGGGALVSFSPLLPSLFASTASASGASADEKVLVVIQLDGGNDGINTVVPYADDGYARARKLLLQKTSELHKLNDHVGLHRSMKAAFELFEDDRLAIVQGVGYPNPNRSHFSSMKIWQTASIDSADHGGYGWLGSALDQAAEDVGRPNEASTAQNAIFVGGQETPVALWGRRSSAISLSRAEDLQLELSSMQSAVPSPITSRNLTDIEQFVRKQSVTAQSAAKAFAQQNQKSGSTASYPDSGLASQLKFVSQLLRGGNTARVFYTIQSGYDTHANQESSHSRLLGEFSEALKAFLNDLKAAKLDDRVVVLAFSEFGRRAAENDSAGTDHGSSGPLFLAGSPVRGGLIGDTPDMSDLVDGDLKSLIDFRQVYATLLSKWLDVPSKEILRHDFETLRLFH